MNRSQTAQDNSAQGIGQQQIDHDIFEKQSSSINIIHVGKYNSSNKQSDGKVNLWKQKEPARSQPAVKGNKNGGRNQICKWIQKQRKWVQKQYKHIEKQCQLEQTQTQTKHPQKMNKKNADTRKQMKQRYEQHSNNTTERMRKFVQKQLPKQYKQKIENTPITASIISKHIPAQDSQNNLNQTTQIFVDQKLALEEQSQPDYEKDKLETVLKDGSVQEEKSQKIKEVPTQTVAVSPSNQSQLMEIDQIQIDFAPRRPVKLSDKNKSKREEIILSRLAFDYSQHCQEQSIIYQQQHQEHSQQEPKQILREILQKNQSPMKPLKIQLSCGNNIREVKVSNVELTVLKLSVCLQQRHQQIQARASCIDEAALSNYVQFHQISHSLPCQYRSDPIYRSATLCKILTTSQNNKDIKGELLQVQALILKCFCGAKNFCPMNAGESLPLSCNRCSAPLQIHITRIEVINT